MREERTENDVGTWRRSEDVRSAGKSRLWWRNVVKKWRSIFWWDWMTSDKRKRFSRWSSTLTKESKLDKDRTFGQDVGILLIDVQLTSRDGQVEEKREELNETHRNMMRWWDVEMIVTKTDVQIALTTPILILRCALKSLRISQSEFFEDSPFTDLYDETSELEHRQVVSGSNRRESAQINMTLRWDSRVDIVVKVRRWRRSSRR